MNYSTTVHRNLLLNRVLAVRRRFGHQIVRGISTDPGAFSQISVRRIVDYAKAGVRLGSNPYIGKLNNARVRAALKATLDGFLSQMVLDEMLTGYELEVTATRAQEIRGICIVTMTLQPDVLHRFHPRDHEPRVSEELRHAQQPRVHRPRRRDHRRRRDRRRRRRRQGRQRHLRPDARSAGPPA